MKKSIFICCIFLLTLMTQAENAQATELSASDIAAIQKFAEQGNAQMQYNLGVLYARGQGVPKDYYEAAKWLLKAADQGEAKAQTMLGLFHLSGRGVSKDKQKGCDLIHASVKHGNKEAIEVYNKWCAK